MLASLQREVTNWRSIPRNNTRKIFGNSMHVRAPILNTQYGCPEGTISAYMKVLVYINTPTALDGGLKSRALYNIKKNN